LFGKINKFTLWWCLSCSAACLMACSLTASIPVVADPPVEALVNREARQILAAADESADARQYRFQLSAFPRPDLLGLSIGGKRIYVSYRLSQLASQSTYYLWMLRQTLAHEIAHELAGHANGTKGERGAVGNVVSAAHLGLPALIRFENYSIGKELEADMYGITYWAKLGWDCAIWIDILKNFQRYGHAGDALHPTDRRLQVAISTCAAQKH
jgi:predicted Zn-dependent protease